MSGVLVLTDVAASQYVIGARAVASGQTGVAVQGDPWAIFSNFSLSKTDEREISFYGFQYTGISEITDAAAALSMPVGKGAVGAGIHRYGFSLFNKTRIRTGYKHSWDLFHAGVVINYTHIQQGGGYGSAGALSADIGLSAIIHRQLWLGTRATNINRPAYAGSDERLPSELAAGISYQPLSEFLVSAEIVKDVRFPISFRGGADVELVAGLNARAGATTNPETYSVGFGYQTDRWQINFAVQQHIPLGLSPALDFGISI